MAARSWRPIPAPAAPDGVIIYDGVCLLCARIVRFVLARDEAGRFRFASAQSPTGRTLLAEAGVDLDDPESMVLFASGAAWFKSDAGLRVLSGLPGWRWTRLAQRLPRGARDWVYDRIARNRYRLFGRAETCLVPDARLAERFLDWGETRPAEGRICRGR